MQSGLFHGNGLIALKLVLNPEATTDGSVKFLGEQNNSNIGVDASHFAN